MKLTNLFECDNITEVHKPRIVHENGDAFLVYCRQCGNEWRVGKDHRGAPDKVEWSELFFEDAVQLGHPIFYKLHGSMETI